MGLEMLPVLATQGAGGGFYVDLLNLQWWQALIGIVVALGLSPAPWITALATGRLLFRADLDERLRKRDQEHEKALESQKSYYEALLVGKDERYADLKSANEANAQAAIRERERAEEITDVALELSDIVRANNHFLESLGAVSEIVEKEDRGT